MSVRKRRCSAMVPTGGALFISCFRIMGMSTPEGDIPQKIVMKTDTFLWYLPNETAVNGVEIHPGLTLYTSINQQPCHWRKHHLDQIDAKKHK